MDANQIATIIENLINDKTDKIRNRRFQRGIVAAVNGIIRCDVYIEGNTVSTKNILCVDSYRPKVGDKVLVASLSDSGLNRVVLGGLSGDTALAAYPVGAIYMSVVVTNPGTLFGGTWEIWGTGRVLVGLDVSDADFNTPEKIGGVKSVTLTSAQSGLPSHNHTQNSHSHGIYTDVNNANANINASEVKLGPAIANSKTVASATATATNNAVTAQNASAPHTNLQPYITCYMWKRTA